MTATAHLLHLDEHLAAVAKPPGLSLATPQRDPTAAVRRLLAALPEAERATLAAGELPLLIHRLDVGTSGLVLLARTKEAHRALVAAFERREVEKRYLALVWGHPRPGAGVWDQALGPDRKDRRRMRVDAEGRRAVTRYATLAHKPHVALLVLEPQTGRTHQIRVHTAAAGHPIVGDDLYGGPRHRAIADPRLRRALAPSHTLLHAWSLTLPAPWPALPAAGLPLGFAAAIDALGLEPPSLADAESALAQLPSSRT